MCYMVNPTPKFGMIVMTMCESLGVGTLQFYKVVYPDTHAQKCTLVMPGNGDWANEYQKQ